jgi:hypothetical protein
MLSRKVLQNSGDEMKESVFLYISTCCSTQATKPPCVKPKAQPKPKKKGKNRGEDKPKAPEFATLGSWRCASCGKPCSVTVMPRPKENKPAEVIVTHELKQDIGQIFADKAFMKQLVTKSPFLAEYPDKED